MNGIRESFFVTGFIFTYVQKYFIAVLRGEGDRPRGSVTDWDFSHSKSFTC